MEKKSALIFGATGLIGQFLVKKALQNPHYETVKVLVRKPSFRPQPKLQEIIFDFENPNTSLLIADDVFCAIGTTLRKAGSKEAQRKIDFEIPLNIAQLAYKQGNKAFFLVSSVGANADTNNFYLGLKGQLEKELTAIGFQHVGIFRPSMLYGNRNEFRIGELIGKGIMKATSFLLFGKMSKYKGIEAENVAQAMINFAQINVKKPVEILEYEQMMKLV